MQQLRSGASGERGWGSTVDSTGYSSPRDQSTFGDRVLEEFIRKSRCRPSNEMLDTEVPAAARCRARGRTRMLAAVRTEDKKTRGVEAADWGSQRVGSAAHVDPETLQHRPPSGPGESRGVSRAEASRRGAGTGRGHRRAWGRRAGADCWRRLGAARPSELSARGGRREERRPTWGSQGDTRGPKGCARVP